MAEESSANVTVDERINRRIMRVRERNAVSNCGESSQTGSGLNGSSPAVLVLRCMRRQRSVPLLGEPQKRICQLDAQALKLRISSLDSGDSNRELSIHRRIGPATVALSMYVRNHSSQHNSDHNRYA